MPEQTPNTHSGAIAQLITEKALTKRPRAGKTTPDWTTCPECGEQLFHASACAFCPTCGWGQCG